MSSTGRSSIDQRPGSNSPQNWTIPCGTKVRITSKQTGKSVIAPVADRGPASWTGVAIDLLPDTWDALGVSRGQGKQKVTYQILGN